MESGIPKPDLFRSFYPTNPRSLRRASLSWARAETLICSFWLLAWAEQRRRRFGARKTQSRCFAWTYAAVGGGSTDSRGDDPGKPVTGEFGRDAPGTHGSPWCCVFKEFAGRLRNPEDSSGQQKEEMDSTRRPCL